MNKYLTIYYTIIGLITFNAVGYTIFISSLFINHGLEYKKLMVEKNNLEYQTRELNLQLAQIRSMDKLTQYALAQNFSPVSKTITLDTSTALAAKWPNPQPTHGLMQFSFFCI